MLHTLYKKVDKMKKIMIVIAIVLTAIVTNAASFSWGGKNVYSSDLTNKYTGTAYLYAYAHGASQDTALQVSSAVVTEGAIASTTFTDDINFTAGNYYDFYFTVADGDMLFTSAVLENKAAYAGNTPNQLSFTGLKADTQNASNWTPVPEPTSGILLLCGLAGLALRRKKV